MGDVKSKNLYELLGNDHEYDSDKEPEPPTKVADNPAARVGKRDGPSEKIDAAATAAVVSRAERDPNRRRGGFTDGDRDFRQRTNRAKRGDHPNPNYHSENVIEGHEGQRRGRDSGPGTQRRGRGDRGPRRGGDRHSRTGQADHPKQGDAAWGGPNASTELADEISGGAQAQAEIAEGGFDASDVPPALEGEGPMAGQDADTALNAEPAAPAEPEDNSKSYADYLIEQATKKAADLGLLEARKPNEGSKPDSKFDNAKALSKEGVDDNYFQGAQKASRQRERKVKDNKLDIDQTWKDDIADRGGRGGRGGRGRGRGDFGDRPPRGERDGGRGGRGRGEYRPRGERGERRGGRGGARGDSNGTSLTVDETSFPSLGGK